MKKPKCPWTPPFYLKTEKIEGSWLPTKRRYWVEDARQKVVNVDTLAACKAELYALNATYKPKKARKK